MEMKNYLDRLVYHNSLERQELYKDYPYEVKIVMFFEKRSDRIQFIAGVNDWSNANEIDFWLPYRDFNHFYFYFKSDDDAF